MSTTATLRRFSKIGLQKTTHGALKGKAKPVGMSTKADYKRLIEDILEKIPGMYHDVFMEWVNMELVKNMVMRSKKSVTMTIPPLPELDVKTLLRIQESYDDKVDSPGSVWLECVRRATYRIEYFMKSA
jgi:hypothetical protein